MSLSLILHHAEDGIWPNTEVVYAGWGQKTDFSKTCFLQAWRWVDAPSEALPIIVQRNAAIFAQETHKHRGDLPIEQYRSSLDPLIHWPEKCIGTVIEYFWADFARISFHLSTYMGWWWRMFGAEWYAALRLLWENYDQESAAKYKLVDPDGNSDMAFFDMLEMRADLFVFPHIFQCFLEGDCARYFLEKLNITSWEPLTRRLVFERMQAYLRSNPDNHDKHILRQTVKSISNSGVISPDITHIPVDWMEWLSNLSPEDACSILATDTFSGVYEREIGLVDSDLQKHHTHEIRGKILQVMKLVYEDDRYDFDSLLRDFSDEEQECVLFSLNSLWKRWKKKASVEICLPTFIRNCLTKKYIFKAKNIATLIEEATRRNIDSRQLEQYLYGLPTDTIAELFHHLDNNYKKTLVRLCTKQISEIFGQFSEGEIFRYAHIIAFLRLNEVSNSFDILFGISNLMSRFSQNKQVLPSLSFGTFTLPLTKRIVTWVQDVLGLSTAPEIIITRSIEHAWQLRQSLLSIFWERFFPIGGKIHFWKSLDQDRIALLDKVVGFGNTPFKLQHADRSLLLPPCQSPLQLMAMLHRLDEIGIINECGLDLQLSVAGRVPNELASISGSACLFAKHQSIHYKPDSFLTSHNDKTATCIMCYDDGQLEKSQFPTLPTDISGRTDMLGFRQVTDVITYTLIGNLISQSYHGGPLWEIGKYFISEYREILEKHGCASILKAKWVHTPNETRDPIDEEMHYKTLKFCTDTLEQDIQTYTKTWSAEWLTFAVKRLLYKYIKQYSLLPVDDMWAQRYMNYLNYQSRSLENPKIMTLEG